MSEWSKKFPPGQYVTATIPLAMTSYKDRSFSPIATNIQEQLLCHISIKATKDDSEGGKRSRLTIKGHQAELAWRHFARETNQLALQGKLKDPGPVPWYKCPPAERIVQEDDENEAAEEQVDMQHGLSYEYFFSLFTE